MTSTFGRRRRPVTAMLLACATLLCMISLPSFDAKAQSRSPAGMMPPSGMTLEQSAAMRFPQPVRVGSLLGRPVLWPVESQRRLGTVRAIRRTDGGTIEAVIRTGPPLGLGWIGRDVAVPIDAMVLLGQVMEVVAYTRAEVRRLPAFAAAGTAELPPDALIQVGLAKPSH